MAGASPGPLRRALSLLGLALLPALAAAEPARLPDWMLRELGRLQIPADAVSIYARDLPSGDELMSLNPQQALRPASTIKLLTTVLAFEVLDREPAFQTDFHLIGRSRRPLRQGVFDGDLLVRGNGDPSLDTARLEAAARRLVRRGVKVIQGDLVLDPGHFPRPPEDPRFYAEVEAPFSASPAPLLVNGKTVAVVIRPLAKGAGVTVALEPALPGVTLENRLGYLATQTCDDPRAAFEIGAQGSAEQASITVEGLYPLACGEFRRSVSVLGADQYFDAAFRQAYERAGGRLEGALRVEAKPRALGARKPFETIPSSPLADIVRETNKHSNNLWAQQLFLRVGMALEAQPRAGATAAVENWLREHLPGVLPATLDSGAGLSVHERISARGLVELLGHAAGRDYAGRFFDSLSVVGVDGTAANRMRDAPLAGKARVKTGTVSDARGLAGLLESAGGGTVLFAILIHHPRAASATGLIDRLTQSLHAGTVDRK